MAQPIYCDSCEDQKVADILITNLNNGEVDAYCTEHYMGFVLMSAEALTNMLSDDEDGGQTVLEEPAPEPEKVEE